MVAARTESRATGSLNQVQSTVLVVAIGLSTLGAVPAVDAADGNNGLTLGMGQSVVFNVRTSVPEMSHQLEHFIAVAPRLLRPSFRVDQLLAVEPDDYPVR